MLEKYSPGKGFALVAINSDPHQTSRHTPVSTRWKKQHIQRELKDYSWRNFEDTLNQSPWRSDEKLGLADEMRPELRSSYPEGHCSSSIRHAFFLLNSMKSETTFYWESRVRKNTSICKFSSSGTSTLWFPWMELVSLFPSSQPSDYNFFSLKCCDACEHSPAGTSEFRTKSLLNRKGDRGNIASSCGEILWHFSQVCGCILWNFYESTSFQFSYSFYGGPVPIIFL